MLGLVDWHLLVLFGGLFVVTAALAQTGLPDEAVRWLAARGLRVDSLAVLAPLTLIGANTVGNVPLVVLLLSVAPSMSESAFYTLAVLWWSAALPTSSRSSGPVMPVSSWASPSMPAAACR
jgi:Na+/H+ antiporter NhaD/arsenite permease-like protein